METPNGLKSYYEDFFILFVQSLEQNLRFFNVFINKMLLNLVAVFMTISVT
jgi:hypothetical protein